MHRASGEELSSNFARLATPAVNSSLFLLIFTSAPEKQSQKQRRPKTRNRKKPKEVDEHYVGPQPTGTQTRNQTKPTDRQTEPSTGPGPGADTKLYH